MRIDASAIWRSLLPPSSYETGLRLLLTRPRTDAAPLAAELERRGHVVLIEPMLEIRPLTDAPLPLDGVQALLLTSRNGVRMLAERPVPRCLPVLAVGDATAREATEAGFTAVVSAGGDVESLIALACRRLRPELGKLVHVGARDTAGDLVGRLGAAGFVVERAILYEAVPAKALSPACVEALAGDALDGVLFFSPRTSRAFASLATAAGCADRFRRLHGFFLSQAVAAASGLAWARLHIAAAPTEAAMLALVDAVERAA